MALVYFVIRYKINHMQNNFKFIFGCWILFVGLSLHGEKEIEAISYHQEIKPIFQANCNGCHQPAKQKGDYLMTDFDSLIEGGETGKPAVVPGKPQDSYLLSQIALDSSGNAEMPKGKNTKPLHEVEIAKIEQWIKEGARDDSPEVAGNLFTMDKKPI